MIKIRLDGAVEHEVPEPVKLHIDALDAKVKALESDKSTLQAKADSAEQLLSAEKAGRAEDASAFQGRLDAGIQSRLTLITLATKHGVKHDGTDEEIRHALIAKALPETKLDDKDANYVQGMFDAAIRHLDIAVKLKEDGSSNAQKKAVSDLPTQEHNDEADWGNSWQRGGVK